MRPYILLLGILGLVCFSFAATNVASCQNLTANDTVYEMNTSITSTSATGSTACFYINATNVTLDCKGYNLVYSTANNYLGVLINTTNFTTIRNCPNISGFWYTIDVYYSNYSVINNNSFYNSVYVDIYLQNANNNNVTNNYMYNSSAPANYGSVEIAGNNNNIVNNTAVTYTSTDYWGSGFLLYTSQGNTLNNNTAKGFAFSLRVLDTSNPSYCNNVITNMWGPGGLPVNYTNSSANWSNFQAAELVLCDANLSNITNVTVTGSRGYGLSGTDGIYMTMSNYVNISNSRTNLTARGVIAYTSPYGTYYNNTLTSPYGVGFILYDGSGYSNFTQNYIYNSSSVSDAAAFYISGATTTNNIYLNNTGSLNKYGFYLGSSSNTLINNTIHDSTSTGYYLTNGSNTLTNNTAYTNAGNGFYLTGNTNTLSSNTAYDNTLYGFRLAGTNNNLTSDTSYNNDAYGFYVQNTGNNLTMATAYGNSYGVYSDYGVRLVNSWLYDNTLEFGWAGDPINLLTITNSKLGDTPSVNLTVSDNSTYGYSLTETDMGYGGSFEDKYLSIAPTNTNSSLIDALTILWAAAEESGYTITNLVLYSYNTTWSETSNQTLNTTAHTMYVGNLNSTTETHGLFTTTPYTLSTTDTDDSSASTLSIDVETSCNGNTVTVTSDGEPVYRARVAVLNVDGGSIFVGYTDADGQVTFNGCGLEAKVHASKSGYESESTTLTLASCCATQCTADADCSASEKCQSGACVELSCPAGEVIVGHECTPSSTEQTTQTTTGQTSTTQPQCTPPSCCTADSECGDTEACTAGKCAAITACGLVQGHAVVQTYECGTETGCSACASGSACVDHVCVQGDVTCPSTAIVGDTKSCSVTQSGSACAGCDYRVTSPDGKASTGKTDEEGKFDLVLSQQGTYQVATLKGGSVVKTITIQANPKATPPVQTPTTKPTQQGSDMLFSVGIIVLLLLVVAAVFFLRKKSNGKK